jgi:hypothetical protein
MQKLQPKSKVAVFLSLLMSQHQLSKPKHPILGVLFGQLNTIIALVDENPEAQQKLSDAFDYIKENWHASDDGR